MGSSMGDRGREKAHCSETESVVPMVTSDCKREKTVEVRVWVSSRKLLRSPLKL